MLPFRCRAAFGFHGLKGETFVPWETVLIVAIIAGALVPAFVVWSWYTDAVNIRVQSGVNDDEAAATMFIRVLDAAQRTLIVHDDGNKMKGTVYDDNRVVEAVGRRLRENQQLNIRCLFNDRQDLELVRRMRSEFPDRFRAWYRQGPRPVGDVHYKIADDGAFGHISTHQHGQPERRFKLLDCSAAKPRTRKHVFRRYLTRFERDIAAATE